jgi:crotonobetainyl-CoA:carnitine CoA-transferase CaiB-like acyl-CoA transferase
MTMPPLSTRTSDHKTGRTGSSTSRVEPSGGPLKGIRVLDLTSVVLGPLATQILGDYGADIIKVESLEGDLMRANGVSKNPGMSSIFLAINRNKRSVAIDLKTTPGQALALQLAKTVDVVIHNMRVPAMERLGLGYQAIEKVNPNVVYCVATGFGQSGPDAARPAFDDVIQAACGLASLIGGDSGKPDYVPSLIADKTTGMAVVNAVLAALFHRERTGQGQFVEVPMLETMTAFTLAEHLGGLSFMPPPTKAGYARILAGGRKPAPTKDGFVAMLPYTAEHWTILFKSVGRDDLAAKYNFHNRQERNARVKELYADLAQVTRQMSSTECLALCNRVDIPATRIYSIDELPEHPHLKAVGMFEPLEHPTEGATMTVRPATLFARTPASIRAPAPHLGEHSQECLLEAGISLDLVEQLTQNGVLKQYTAFTKP